MKLNELIVFLHNDLDAAGSQINIEYKFPEVKKKYFYTNYGDLPQKVQEIADYVQENGNEKILCADVSFSDNPQALRILTQLGSVTVIDHHMYPDGFWENFPEVKVIYDKTKSAALICNEYFSNTGKNPNLDKLTNIINLYDLWQDLHPGFGIAQDLNEYFWTYSVDVFSKTFIENGWKLPKDYSTVVAAQREKFALDIADLEKRKLIHRMGETTLVFADSCFNQILIKDMKKGQNFVINFSSYGIVKVRINQRCGYPDVLLNTLRLELTGNAESCHLHAFTYRIEKVNFNKLMDEAQRIVRSISKIFSKKETK